MTVWLKRGFAALGLLALLLGAIALLADTSFGHRLIANAIAAQSPRSGLKINIGRIEGSIYSRARLKDVRFSDPQGRFLTSPEIVLDWRPLDWLRNRLTVHELAAGKARLERLPRLRPGREGAPILPGFDIRVDRFRIDQLVIEPAVAGTRRLGRVSGQANIRQGRALVALDADAALGDRLKLLLDAEPDKGRFDADARLSAPRGGVFSAMIGSRRPLELELAGAGDWKVWKGRLGLASGAAALADLGVTARDGRFGIDGQINLMTLTRGKLQRLTAPALLVRGDAEFARRRLTGLLLARSAALAVTAEGALDFARSRFDPVSIDARLLSPPALFSNMTGRDVRLQARLTGAMGAPSFDYLLTAPRAAFGPTGFEDVRASGRGRIGKAPVTVPLRLTARRVTGVGNVAGGILANLAVEGDLRVDARRIAGDLLRLRSDKLNGQLNLNVDLATGQYDVWLAGEMQRYFIPGLGIVDIRSELKAVPGVGGRGTRVEGKGQAWVRRFDNRFLAGLARGLPVLQTGLYRDADGVLHFANLRVSSPGLSLAGSGRRDRDGSFHFVGSGHQSVYGPIARLVLDGRIERPRIELLLSRPNAAMGLRDVALTLLPGQTGYGFSGGGQSRLGRFATRGNVLLPQGADALVAFDAIDLSGASASGRIAIRSRGLEGRLSLAGALTGTLDLSPSAEGQRIRAAVRARNGQFDGPPLIAAQRAQFEGDILLGSAGTTLDGTLTGQGMRWGGISLARLAANIQLRNGSGQVRASLAGARGRSFDLQTVAQLAPGSVSLVGSGTIDRKPVRLAVPALFEREAQGWRLRPAVLEFAGGTARVSGLFGDTATAVDAQLAAMPLSIFDIVRPGLNLAGMANGTISYADRPGAPPTGSASLKVKGFARAGFLLTSDPIDAAINAALTGDRFAARAVAASDGRIAGRGQIRVNLAPGGTLMQRFGNGAMNAQLRYNGRIGPLWKLTGLQTLSMSGPVGIGADIRGTPFNPAIAGSLAARGARVESPATGMVLTDVAANGRFSGSRLEIPSFTATAGASGQVTGSGSFDFSAGMAPRMDLRLSAANALLVDRDDLAANVSGPLSIRSDGAGGIISGDLELVRSRFRLGKAGASASIPRLDIREINRPGAAPGGVATGAPWRFAITAKAPRRLAVTGLGLDSEWQADLRIGGTVENPALSGRAELIDGDYEFAGRTFDLKRGTIRFNGTAPPNPDLEILAQRDAEGISATIRVTGTGLAPRIAFSSVPALPEEELLSRMLFGTSIANLSAPEAVQLAAAVASLRAGGDGLNPINALRDAIGLDRLRVLPGNSATGQRTSIAAGKYLSRRAYVEVITDGQGYSATHAEFQITRWLSLLSTISTIGRQSAAVRVSKDY